MTFAVLTNEYKNEILNSIDNTEILYSQNGVINCMDELEKISYILIDILIIDMTATDNQIQKAIRRYRIKVPDTRIIIIANGLEYGDVIISSFISMGLWDIIDVANSEDEEIIYKIKNLIANPNEYEDIEEWDLISNDESAIKSKKNILQKNSYNEKKIKNPIQQKFKKNETKTKKIGETLSKLITKKVKEQPDSIFSNDYKERHKVVNEKLDETQDLYIDNKLISENEVERLQVANEEIEEQAAVKISEKQRHNRYEKYEQNILGTIAIAVCGITRGVGCTHVVLTIATYLQSIGYSVAINEMNTSGDFSLLREYIDAKIITNHYTYKNIDVFNNQKMSMIMRYGYDYVVIDIGSILIADIQGKQNILDEIERANMKICVTGSSEWNLMKLSDFTQGINDKWYFLFNNTPGLRKKLISDLMVDYTFYFVKNYDYRKISEETQEIIDSLLQPVLIKKAEEKKRKFFIF